MASNKFTSPTLYLKFRGVFDHAKLAKVIQDWIDDNTYEYHAKKYKLKVDAAEYDAFGKREISEYATFTVGVHLWARGMKDVEIIKDGEKVKMQEGYINFEIYASIEYDPEGRFQGNKFFQWLQDFYHHYVIKQVRTDVWEDDILLKQQQLLAHIKNFLGVEIV